MDKAFIVWQGVLLRNRETGASDGFCNTEAFSEATYESRFAGADVADKFNDYRCYEFLSKLLAVVEHFLFGVNNHGIIIS